MAITFRQLDIFVAAASDCNFRRTSRRLGVSQPSISKHVRALEEQFGKALFERRRGCSPILSTEGIRYLEKAQELLERRQELDLGRSGESGGTKTLRLRVTAGAMLLDAYIRPQLPAFCASHPNIVLEFVPMHPQRSAESMVLGGDVDLAVLTREATENPHVETEILATVGCSIYASPALYRRASRSGVKLGDLPFLMPPTNYPPTRWIQGALKGSGVELRNIVGRSQFPDVLLGMAIEGRGAVVLFDHYAAQAVAAGELLTIGPSMPSMQRVMLVGLHAKCPAAQPAVEMFRQATRCLGMQPFTRHESPGLRADNG